MYETNKKRADRCINRAYEALRVYLNDDGIIKSGLSTERVKGKYWPLGVFKSKVCRSDYSVLFVSNPGDIVILVKSMYKNMMVYPYMMAGERFNKTYTVKDDGSIG